MSVYPSLIHILYTHIHMHTHTSHTHTHTCTVKLGFLMALSPVAGRESAVFHTFRNSEIADSNALSHIWEFLWGDTHTRTHTNTHTYTHTNTHTYTHTAYAQTP